MEELFNKIYYKPDTILNTKQKWDAIKADPAYKKEMTKKLYNEWVDKQEQEQINKTKHKTKQIFTHPIIAGPNAYQCDIVFFDKYMTINKNYNCILCFVEITTKYAYAYPLKSKEAEEVFTAFNLFLKDAKKLKQIELDGGNEFNKIIKYCEDKNILTLIYNGDKNSMAIVERFNRTLRNHIKKVSKGHVWIDKLNSIVKQYNTVIHASTGHTPEEMKNNDKLATEYRQQLIWDGVPAKLEMNKMKVGDKVRAYEKVGTFGKGSGKYSDDIKTITSIEGNTIYLDNSKKKFRYYDLKTIKHAENTKTEQDKQDIAAAEKAAKQYKVARKLHKELGDNDTKVLDTINKLDKIMNAPRQKRNTGR